MVKFIGYCIILLGVVSIGALLVSDVAAGGACDACVYSGDYRPFGYLRYNCEDCTSEGGPAKYCCEGYSYAHTTCGGSVPANQSGQCCIEGIPGEAWDVHSVSCDPLWCNHDEDPDGGTFAGSRVSGTCRG